MLNSVRAKIKAVGDSSSKFNVKHSEFHMKL